VSVCCCGRPNGRSIDLAAHLRLILPAFQVQQTIWLEFTDFERAQYQQWEAILLPQLMTKDPKTGMIMWNARTVRRLMLNSTWLWFHHLIEYVDRVPFIDAVRRMDRNQLPKRWIQRAKQLENKALAARDRYDQSQWASQAFKYVMREK
jgi:hypothetical protein